MISKGILAFAQGNTFLKLAVYQLIQLRLVDKDIGAAYVVSSDADKDLLAKLSAMGAEIVVADSLSQPRNYDVSGEWKNLGRETAFELSPWDNTLLVDVDYVIQSKASLQLLDCKLPQVCGRWHHIFNQDFVLDSGVIGRHGIPMLWATLVWFDKGPRSQELFVKWQEALKYMKWKQEHYGFYSSLVRNDYALSIAAHELGQETGHKVPVAPYSQHAIPPWCTYEQTDRGLMVSSTTVDRPAQVVNLDGIDFHALNKTALLEAL